MTAERSSSRPSGVQVAHVDPDGVASLRGQLSIAYCAAFGGPPWSEETHEQARFISRFEVHRRQSGFRCVIATDVSGLAVHGFAYGMYSFAGDEIDPRYGYLAAVIGSESAENLLADAFEFAELAVVPTFRRRGVGRALHDALLTAAGARRAWLLTRPDALAARALYQSAGWGDVAEVPLPDRPENRLLLARSTR